MKYTNRGEDKQGLALRMRAKLPRVAEFVRLVLHPPLVAYRRFKGMSIQWRCMAAVVVLILADIYGALSPFFAEHAYALGTGAQLLPDSSQEMADRIKFDSQQQSYSLNGQTPVGNELGRSTLAGSTLYTDAKKGITVSDPVNKIDFTMVPQFGLEAGRQDKDRIVYPLSDGTGMAVYTVQGVGVKEDIILTSSPSDERTYTYKLQLGDSLRAQILSGGSLGIYGNTLLSGNVTAGTDKDAALLKKARQNAQKTTLLFTIPAPIIVDRQGPVSDIQAKYSLDGDKLSVNVTGLKQAKYPIAIDPSIYVVTASQFMYGNNETNVNFDVSNKLIKKGRTTGARFNSWNSTAGLPSSVWGASTVASGGFIYSVGGTTLNGQVFTSQGANTWIVPTGVTSITVKLWGGGGGGGGGSTSGTGGAGGGGGYTTAVIPVTAGQTLDVYVGGGGGGGAYDAAANTAGGGGGGGGYSAISLSGTILTLAGGGGGGGGARNSTNAGAAGPGGCTTTASTCNGVTVGNGLLGGGATTTVGGTVGSSGGTNGLAGTALTGGAGADGANGGSNTGNGVAGGLASGGNGGLANVNVTRGAGGGGGAGKFGGGGGGSTSNQNNNAGGGGGGGSNYNDASNTSVSNSIGSGATPANNADTDRNGAAGGGTGGAATGTGATGSNGIVRISFGSSSTPTATVNWAKFNTGSGTIDNADPGSGACSGWCSASAYALPSARANFSLVAYNGFLYALGGSNTAGTRQSTVYIAKLGANGEPRLWHPSDTNKNNWVYWYSDTSLNSIRAYSSAVAYNNRIYLVGGVGVSAPVTTVEYASINPNGTLATWTSTTALGTAVYGHNVQVYNDYLYVLGGSATIGGAPSTTVSYNKINSDGTLNAWTATATMSTGRMTAGGNFAVIWGAYIYISGGCSTVNASGYCTNVLSDTQIASINADGSLDSWVTMSGVSNARTGHNLFAWRDNLYILGGCSAQNTTTGDCNNNMLATINYGVVNQDGDVSTVSSSVASGAGTCTGGTPTNCNITAANMLETVFIANGFLYVVGGCTNVGCTTTSSAINFTGVTANGDLVRPASCPTGSTASNGWCTLTATLSAARAGMSATVFNRTVYLVGGFTGAAISDIVERGTLNNDGTITSISNQTLTGVSAVAVSYTYAYSRANPSSAGTNPGNLYIFGGCTTSGSGPTCSAFTDAVYKCNITTTATIASCSTTSQLQIGTITGASGAGLAIASGTVYANYIYLVGGSAPNLSETNKVRYAKFDNSNNIVTVGSGWTESGQSLPRTITYASSFGYNGYLYVVGGYNASNGIQNSVNFIKLSTSDGSLDTGGWVTSTATITGRWGLTINVSNGYAYIIGGCSTGNAPTSCSTMSSAVERMKIYNNNNGAAASFSTAANTYSTDPNRVGVSAAVLNGYIYAAGGCNGAGSYCLSASGNVSYSAIDAYGGLGTWSSTSGSLPAHRAFGKLRAAGGTLYYLGGQSDTASDFRTEVYYGTPSSGNVSSWSTASNGLPNARTNFGAAVWNNRLYVVGGQGSGTGCSGGVCNTVYVSPQLNGGGDITSAWSTGSTSFNVARSGLVVVAYANNLYLFGGYDGTNYLNDSQYSQINTSSGDAGSWTYSESMPQPLAQGDGFAANGYMYVVGGLNSLFNCTTTTFVAPISANTSIASGNNPTGVGTWYQANQQFSGARAGNAAVYNNGKEYVLGGACTGNGYNASSGVPGSGTYTVPAGVTAITAKAWGAGGGSAFGETGAKGGEGGGGGFTQSTFTVTPGETLNVYVGGGGGAGGQGLGNTKSSGAGGGGYTGVARGATMLMNAGGGGGGGGSVTTPNPNGGNGGPGGCSSSGTACNGVAAPSNATNGAAGGGATTAAGGAASTGLCPGAAGAALLGGNGGALGNFFGYFCSNSSGGSAGTNGGGTGGVNWDATPGASGGGAGGGGKFGGGGGAAGGNGTATNGGSGGGGGGSSYTANGCNTGVDVCTAGSGNAPGNSSDPDRGTAGTGGLCSANGCAGSAGNNGFIMIQALIYASPVIAQTAILSQPQVAKYSIAFDTDADVYPTHWLLNGLDNSIGAQWQLKYQTMSDPFVTGGPNGTGKNCSAAVMSTWGQATTVNPVTLGTPGAFTPLDSGGTNMKCGRFYNMFMTVDASQAFGYPDDVSRGPTIEDLTLRYTAAPAKRLMHGRTFTGGLQMPVDTPYYAN
jgi:hypothetical protein